MASTPDSRRSLDGPPPAAPGNVKRVLDVPMAASMGASAISPATMPQALIEHAMLAEQVLTSLAKIAPSLTPMVAQIIETLRMNVAGLVQGGAQPNMGMGQPAPAPAGPGAVAPMA